MPKGINNVNVRKMRRLMKRQHQKGKISNEDMKEFVKQVENRNETSVSRKRTITDHHLQSKMTNPIPDTNIAQNIIATETVNIQPVNIPINDTHVSIITICVCTIQIMMSCLIVWLGNTWISHLIGFIATLCEIIKCVLMKRFPYKQSNDESQKKLMIIDMMTSVGFVITGTSYLMMYDLGFLRMCSFTMLSIYKLYTFNSSCFVDGHYIKDLTPSMLGLSFYLIVYFNSYRILFNAVMMFMYRDIKDVLLLNITTIFNGFKQMTSRIKFHK